VYLPYAGPADTGLDFPARVRDALGEPWPWEQMDMNYRRVATMTVVLTMFGALAANGAEPGAELAQLRAENALLKKNLRRLVAERSTLRKQNAELRARLAELIRLCREKGIGVKDDPKTVEPGPAQPVARPALNPPLTAEQKATVAAHQARRDASLAEFKRLGKSAGAAIKKAVMMQHSAAAAKALANYGQSKGCLEELVWARQQLGTTAAKGPALWCNPFERACRDAARTFHDKWKAPEVAVAACALCVNTLHGGAAHLLEVAHTCEMAARQTRQPLHFKAAAALYEQVLKMDGNCEEALTRLKQLLSDMPAGK